ncbi:dihydrodipicolinate synthase family protein [Peterkaempfera sp. SMS 1(5)a]|uniref:dihydrodipicolinate synthase family protein n=1 Tax=Peterkaempfera podocarpi TaxID=3232308 RepID=UPI003673472B
MRFDRQAAALADVVAIPVTPFAEDGTVDRPAYRALVARLARAGVRAVTPNGNTGEFYALTAAERRAAVVDTVAAADGAEVLAGVGQDNAGAIDAARHAQQAGASMVMVHQPVHPYVALDGWIDYHRAVADAVPDLGVVPYVRNPRIGGTELRRLGELCPNVIGVKYAVPDPVRFASVARDAGLDRFVWVAGLAELSAPGYWAVGATGFTSGLVNAVPELSLQLLAALRGGDYPGAMKVWEQIRSFEELRAADESANNVSVVKEALAQLGLCRREVRTPSRLLDPEGRTEVARLLAEWNATA